MDVCERLSGNQLLAPPRVIRPDALSQPAGERLRYAMTRDRAEVLAVVEKQASEFGPAEGVRLVQDRVKHRRQIARRRIDDLQDLSGRGLLLQRLARLAEQSDVLDRNNRLVGEGLEQVDLRLRKRLDLATRYCDRPDRIAVPQDGHREHGTHARLEDGRQ